MPEAEIMVDINHFDVFGLTVSYMVDKVKIDSKYFELQKQAHPDICSACTAKSRLINDSYLVLKDDMKRAEHILHLHKLIVNRDIPDDIDNMMSQPKYWYDKQKQAMEDYFRINDLHKAYHAWLACKYLSRMIQNI